MATDTGGLRGELAGLPHDLLEHCLVFHLEVGRVTATLPKPPHRITVSPKVGMQAALVAGHLDSRMSTEKGSLQVAKIQLPNQIGQNCGMRPFHVDRQSDQGLLHSPDSGSQEPGSLPRQGSAGHAPVLLLKSGSTPPFSTLTTRSPIREAQEWERIRPFAAKALRASVGHARSAP